MKVTKRYFINNKKREMWEMDSDKKRNGTAARAVVCAGSLAVFFVILFLMKSGKAAAFDDAVRFFFYDIRSGALTSAAKAITYLGNWQSVTVLCIILLIIKPTRVKYGVPVSAGAIFVTILNKIIKNLVQRGRPDQMHHLISQGGYSFSSGHSITSMFVFGILIYLVRVNMQNRTAANVLTVILAVPMVCIGLSRIYLGVHYPTDVLAGWALGLAVMMVVIEIADRFRRRSHEPSHQERS